MKEIQNSENISTIIMKPFAECLCGIGQDWYHIQFEITFIPKYTYPDYMEIAEYVSKEISGKELNIESAVDKLGTMLWQTYTPRRLTVKGIVDNVVTHFPVEVIKEF